MDFHLGEVLRQARTFHFRKRKRPFPAALLNYILQTVSDIEPGHVEEGLGKAGRAQARIRS
jgi:hypothetical protein